MSAEMPAELKRWEATRKRGRGRYVVTTGVLAWGVPMFAVMTFFVNRRPGVPLSPAWIAFSAVLWAFGGALFGFVMWRFWEKRYMDFVTAQNSVQGPDNPADGEP
ncbi:MAG: hypothetical protein GXX96_20110 [Planctomycetaceae bacterium]|nr:hypothetical protein [Planctomycetaceae bacterium]